MLHVSFIAAFVINVNIVILHSILVFTLPNITFDTISDEVRAKIETILTIKAVIPLKETKVFSLLYLHLISNFRVPNFLNSSIKANKYHLKLLVFLII